MKAAKTHIKRWAPQDYRTSRVRARSISTQDPWLRLIYLEALDALYEAGGDLPADPEDLTDLLGCPVEEIARCLPILDRIARIPGCRGGLLVESGRLSNLRCSEDLAEEVAFRHQQSLRGARGGYAKGAADRGERLALANQAPGKEAENVATAEPVVTPPAPAPTPYASASASAVPDEARVTTVEDMRRAAVGTNCPECGKPLRRQKGQVTNGVGRGVGWYCQAKAGGCGAEFRREDARIVSQLPTRIQENLRGEIQAEERADADLARAQESPGRRAVRELMAQREPANGAWDDVLERLQATTDPHSWRTWLRPTTCVGQIGDRLLVRVPEPMLAWVRDKYAGKILLAAGQPVTLLTDDLIVDLEAPAATPDLAGPHAFTVDPLVIGKGDLAPLCLCGKREEHPIHAPCPEAAVAQAKAHVLGGAA